MMLNFATILKVTSLKKMCGQNQIVQNLRLLRQRSKSTLRFRGGQQSVTVDIEKKILSYKKCDRGGGGSRNSKNSVTYYPNAALHITLIYFIYFV